MTRSEHIHALLEDYARQRAENERALQARVADACARQPEIARLRRESAELALSSVRAILSQKTPEERQALADDMKRRGRANAERIRQLLAEAGLPEDALTLRYRCDKCRDTGYVGEAPARFCDCFEARLRRRLYEDGTMAGVDRQNFDAFREEVAPEADGQRANLALTRKMCETYADSFPHTRTPNLLLSGQGGLGKTFLLNCVYERVTSRGFPAVRITAFRLFEAMRRQHFGESDGAESFDDLLKTPLLLIDDLGTEPMMRNITVEYLFTLLNERMAARRHTMICTNLSPVELKERYGERVASRLLDRSTCTAAQMKGKDLRQL